VESKGLKDISVVNHNKHLKTMGAKNKQKQAVVIIHGIGNQYPMDTAREFVENIKDKNDILYSSPDREANFFETRRLSLSRKKTDFYEFYWANLVSEPANSSLMDWILKLFIFKKPSVRAKRLILCLRIFVISILIAFAAFMLKDYLKTGKLVFCTVFTTGLFGVFIYLVVRYLLPRFNIIAAQTIGDAVKYLTPSPQNIDSRYKIKQKGVSLLKRLHEKKDRNGNPLYSRIVIVGHSLGSVVGYDIITNLWHDYIYCYAPEKAPVLQPKLDEMTTLLIQYHQNKNSQEFPLEAYNQLQHSLFKEIKSLENPWLISDFITIGSPLCHGAYIMGKDEAEFERKTNYRELPLNPSKIEVKLKNEEIVKDYKNAISYIDTLPDKEGNAIKMRIINHSSQFSFIRWSNIYFTNDYVGGDLKNYFGEGIKNYCFAPKGSVFKKMLPCFSHTDYWNKEQIESIALLRDLLKIKDNDVKIK
jgi:hypothetical protein